MTILVADDSKTNRFLLQEVLKGQGYRVATASNGAEALREARQRPPDLIVTDIMMPVMDGFTLCWEWKRDERLNRIPLICYTGTYTDEQNRKFALELGAERFVVSTGNPEDLIKVIREVLGTRQRGGLAAVRPDVADKTVYLKQHNKSLARKLDDKIRQLEQAHRGLQRDVAERKRAEQILRNYTARLQTVSRKLLEVQEDERRRLARELHDQVGQVLTALKINLQVMGRQPAAAPVALKIEECAQIADAALQQVRTLMLDLRPPQLNELGLAVALRTHAERIVTPANLALHFSAPAVPPKIPPAIEIVCFRIAQEALTNILRHAGARDVWIELAVDGDGLKLTVRDDGKGFDLAEAHWRAMRGGSIGLLSMEERAALADGRIEISTAPGMGTTVRAMFSLQAAQSTVDTA